MPEMFGRYELYELLGSGAMGEVYRAHDTVRDRAVAVKVLAKHLATDESFKERFRRESQLAARLNEPHIVPIHDFGEIDGRLFLDMRLVEGRDLGAVLAEHGALESDTAVDIISQVAAALGSAHANGLVHRDVKPTNVLLTGIAGGDYTNPFAYLVDFGIARSSIDTGTALTATSATIGTVAYMSPERIAGGRGDQRSDIYALACVLFEMLTGRTPFDGEMVAVMYAHMHTPVPSVSAYAPRAPRALDDVVRKGMAKNPDDRYATAGLLAVSARAALGAPRGSESLPTRLAPPAAQPPQRPTGGPPPRVPTGVLPQPPRLAAFPPQAAGSGQQRGTGWPPHQSAPPQTPVFSPPAGRPPIRNSVSRVGLGVAAVGGVLLVIAFSGVAWYRDANGSRSAHGLSKRPLSLAHVYFGWLDWLLILAVVGCGVAACLQSGKAARVLAWVGLVTGVVGIGATLGTLAVIKNWVQHHGGTDVGVFRHTESGLWLALAGYVLAGIAGLFHRRGLRPPSTASGR